MGARMKTCLVADCSKHVHARGFCFAHWYRNHKYGDPLGGPTRKGAALQFYKEVVLPYEGGECLIWPFALNHGRGALRINGRTNLVSRLVCEAAHGPAPTPKHEAAHNCGRGFQGCVTLKHLRWATHADNMADTLAHGTHNRGERHGMSKLSEDQVREIRASRGPLNEIGAHYGVSPVTVHNIMTRTNWGWLE